jgi:predicted transcriptional regulator
VSHRTTLTLEDDVAARIQEEARATGKPFKSVVNEALRRGLERTAHPRRVAFRVAARELGVRPGMDLDDVEGLLDQIEGVPRR